MQTFNDFGKTYKIAQIGKKFMVKQFNDQGHMTGEMITDAAWLKMMGFEFTRKIASAAQLIKMGMTCTTEKAFNAIFLALPSRTKFVTVFRHALGCLTTASGYCDSHNAYTTDGFDENESEPLVTLVKRDDSYELFYECMDTGIC